VNIHRRNTRAAQKAPGPKGSLVWGSLSSFKKDAIGFLSQSVRDHGDVVRLRFGPVVAHLVNRPEYAEQVLSRGASRYDKHTRSVARLRAVCGGSLLSSDGPAWLRHRRLIQPVFQPRYLESLGSTIDETMAATLDHWSRLSATNGSIDIVSEMARLTIAIAAKILFASDVGEDAETVESSLAVILDDTWRRLEAPLDPSMISRKFHRRRFREAVGRIDAIVYRIIDQRRRCGLVNDDLLSRLLIAHEGQSETRLTDQELRDAVVTLLLAGHETTANALAWTFYLVSHAPEKNFELADLRTVFSEAIRLYPSIWIIERRVIENDRIGSYAIPRGTTVLISPYLLHRHKEFWPRPEEFIPERFEPDQLENRQACTRPRGAYIPFGLGPHRCIGEHMASLVATRIMANVFAKFRLRWIPGQTVGMVPGITLRHSGELRMKPEMVRR
jgi:cytochrome P450